MSDSVSTNFRSLSPEDVQKLLDEGAEVFILDVREPRAFHTGHIPDAILLPADDFADRYDREVSSDDPVIIVCEKGMTSEAAAKFLVSLGFTDVATMAGGMNAWQGELKRTR